ncbi:MAG TPA: galactokinase [Dermatophilaceae bacterium]|nr:galactokinase [Dermatophilaceae bacterium]
MAPSLTPASAPSHRTAGVWSAPGRVNLIGEHTDYNGGLALPIALPQRTTATVRPRTDGVLHVTSTARRDETVVVALDEISPTAPGGWAAYVAGVFWALRKAGYAVPAADVHIASAVPVGAGLSSSAALECAVAAALSDLAGLDLLADDTGRARLADLCRVAENEIAGAPTGGMDQSAAMLCRPGHALRLDCRSGETTHIPFDLAAHGLTLLVIDTKAHHALVDGQYAARRHTCEASARTLGVDTLREVAPADLPAALDRLGEPVAQARVRHVVTEIARVDAFVDALRGADFTTAGWLMSASHASLRDDYEVSCAELDLAAATALREGALGARMTGGGFGGCCIALVERDRADAVGAAVVSAFRERGWRDPTPFTVTAARGAGRER